MANKEQRTAPIFDTHTKAVSLRWLAEYEVKVGCTPAEAIVAANEGLEVMLRVFALVTDKPDVTEEAKAQLLDLKADIEAYLKATKLFREIRDGDYRERIVKGDPSLFATSGSAVGVRQWGMSFADREGISEIYLTPLFTFVVHAINNLKAEDYDLDQEVPDIGSIVEGTPSLEWVIDCHFRHDVPLLEAHSMGVEQLLQAEEATFNA